MAKQFKDKVSTLKAIANGKESFNILRPPQHYVVLKRTDQDGIITYEHNRIVMDEDQYAEWYRTNVREEIDQLICLIEILYRRDANGGIEEVDASWLEVHQEPIQAHKQPETEIAYTPPEEKNEPPKEPVKALRLKPYREHIEFNKRIINKLFS